MKFDTQSLRYARNRSECIDIFTTTMRKELLLFRLQRQTNGGSKIKSPEVIQLVSGKTNPRVPVFSRGAIVTVPQPPYPSPARTVSTLTSSPHANSKQALTCLPSRRLSVTSARLPAFPDRVLHFSCAGPSVFPVRSKTRPDESRVPVECRWEERVIISELYKLRGFFWSARFPKASPSRSPTARFFSALCEKVGRI